MKQLLDLHFEEFQNELVALGLPKFRAKQIWHWVHEKRVFSIDDMKNIDKKTKHIFSEHYQISTMILKKYQESKDGTEKFLFELSDGEVIETVLMPQRYGYSICITTQVGCRIGCKFCASGVQGLVRNLRVGEIVEQMLQVQKHLDQFEQRIKSIVVMGIGEPFDNYDAVMKTLEIINAEHSLNIGARHITISTSGITNMIERFADERKQYSLAISLHSADEHIRTSIMPITAVHTLEKLQRSLKYYVDTTHKRLTFEYLLLDGINDRIEDADKLARFTRKIDPAIHVNLIPYNEVSFNPYRRSNELQITAFKNQLETHGINVTLRKEFGTDIDAACGQLRINEISG